MCAAALFEFGVQSPSQVRPVETGAVALSQVVTEQQLVEHSEAFENAIAGRDRAALQVQ